MEERRRVVKDTVYVLLSLYYIPETA